MATPLPVHQSEAIDLDGNTICNLWFALEPTSQLQIQTLSEVETHLTNPFDYRVAPWAGQLPIDYPSSMLWQLQPYLTGQYPSVPAVLDPIAIQLAEEIKQAVCGNTTSFLTELNGRIYKTCQQIIRDTGDPWPPGVTWTKQIGSCRDLTVLFMEVCRAIGVAARFVSGYQEGDLDNPELHLHAWAEAYVPGAGWRAYDPSHGLAVSDRHIALVASAVPRYTAPVSGGIDQAGGAESHMTYQLAIQRSD